MGDSIGEQRPMDLLIIVEFDTFLKCFKSLTIQFCGDSQSLRKPCMYKVSLKTHSCRQVAV